MADKQQNKSYQPFALIILDGYGIAPSGPGNAVRLAKTPHLDYLFKDYPYTQLTAHGKAVGLFENTDGNSEAGHINLGAGRIVVQDLVAVSKMIEDGTFFKNAAFIQAIKHVQENNSNLHLMGLLTGRHSAHAYPEHLRALLKLSRQKNIKRVYLHLFTDGRDSPPYEAYKYLSQLQKELDPKREKIATIMGRFFGMDRKKEWGRTELAYNALILARGKKSNDPLLAIENAYGSGESDEYIYPTVIYEAQEPLPRIKNNDAVIFFNARSDRARQLTKAFVQDEFNQMNPGSFSRHTRPQNLIFVALTDFGPDLPNILTAYPSPDIKNSLPMALADVRQLYIAETDKYGHMTYFFNGGYDHPVGGEDRVLVHSPDVDSYDQAPHMSAGEITDLIERHIPHQFYDFFGVNFANPDMVGHTGNLTATIQAIQFLDKCIQRLTDLIVKKYKGYMVITADHGNAEEMIEASSGKVDTQHSGYPVPLSIVGPQDKVQHLKLKQNGVLANVAPTILDLMGRSKPQAMTADSLIIK